MTCEICRGAGYVRLPRYRSISATYAVDDAPLTAKIESAYKEITCPECRGGETTDPAHVSIFEGEVTFDQRLDHGPGFMRAVQGQMANELAHTLLEKGLISFSGPEKTSDYRMRVTGRAGVVSQDVVATIDQRAAEKMETFLGDVADKAAKKISMWGSHYTGDEGAISKAMAMQFVREAFRDRIKEVREGVANDRG